MLSAMAQQRGDVYLTARLGSCSPVGVNMNQPSDAPYIYQCFTSGVGQGLGQVLLERLNSLPANTDVTQWEESREAYWGDPETVSRATCDSDSSQTRVQHLLLESLASISLVQQPTSAHQRETQTDVRIDLMHKLPQTHLPESVMPRFVRALVTRSFTPATNAVGIPPVTYSFANTWKSTEYSQLMPSRHHLPPTYEVTLTGGDNVRNLAPVDFGRLLNSLITKSVHLIDPSQRHRYRLYECVKRGSARC